MLKINGSPKTLCDGITRRDLLHLGGLGAFGLPLSGFLRLQEAQAETAAEHQGARFGQAKACILIHLFGAAPQHETFDPKPLAPVEIQGEMGAIPTCLPGVPIGEGLPQIAKILDRLTVIRSMTHQLPLHGVHYAMSGIPEISPTVEADPNDRTLWPSIGSVVDYLDRKRSAAVPRIPRHIAMPFVLYSRARFRPLGGPYAGFLGSACDPVWTDFPARGTRAVPKPNGAVTDEDGFDPFGGIRPEDKFSIGGPAALPEDLSPQRVGLRRALLQQFDASRRWLDDQQRVRSFNGFQDMAWSLLTSNAMGQALDVQQEPESLRAQYGMTLFGQSLLAARRIIQAGGRFVTVFWDAYGHSGGGWDTHYQHYPRLKELLLPGFDQSFSALIADLEAQGMLDETLVVCISEHGRTPKIDSKPPGAARHHWSLAYSAAMAGGGAARGRVVGKTDAIGAHVTETPISPKDVLATSFHLLGIDPHTQVRDAQDRPFPVAGDGELRPELLA